MLFTATLDDPSDLYPVVSAFSHLFFFFFDVHQILEA